ncbi:MAG TPA: GDSL-type esterase/lipase family protein, partial [Planctomycetota bacterium]|nr:GDSL-type esterase/lipase family protein [Planctomycetota bacterium]
MDQVDEVDQVDIDMKAIRSLVFAACVGFCCLCAAETSYLRANDEIVCVGDSVTAAGVYVQQVQDVLQALYPDGGIRLVNIGSGGKTVDAGAVILDTYLRDHRPTLALFMFGVNDTGWSDRDAERKEQAFAAALAKAAEVAAAKDLPLILLKESHFSHGKDPAPDAFENKVNAMLDRLFAVQDKFAAERGIRLIDVNGTYRRALAVAWAKDPAYEFSPDIVHPNSAGHSAMAVEILRALGAGLPLALADGPRGPLHIKPAPDISFASTNHAGTAERGSRARGGATITLEVKNGRAKAENGTL